MSHGIWDGNYMPGQMTEFDGNNVQFVHINFSVIKSVDSIPTEISKLKWTSQSAMTSW